MSTKHTLEQLLGVSKDLFKIASLSDAILEHSSANRLVVKSIWSQIDIEKNERTKYQRNHVFEVDAKSRTNLVYTSHPEALRSEVWNTKSPDNKSNAVVFNWKDNAEEKQFLEIWKDGVRTENINLTKLDKHAKIYEKSALLGSFEWSPDSTKIAYVAETKNEAKEKCLFNSKLAGEDGVNETNYEKKYANFLKDEWGEQYLTKSESTIAVFDVTSNQVRVLDNLPKDCVPAQLSWYKNQGLVFNGLYTKPYRLGLVYCPIRRSDLFYYDLEQNKCTQITDLKTEAVRGPQFSHDFKKVCWLQNQAGGPHFQCSKLMMMNWEDKSIQTLVDIVRDYPTDDQSFPGVFAYTLPSKSCWSADSQRILINTTWKHANRLISVDIESKKVTNITSSWNVAHTCNLLQFNQDWILASQQAYNKRPSLVIAKLPPRGQELDIQWNELNSGEDSLAELANVEVLKFKPNNPNPSYPNLEFEAWFVDAKKRNDTLIVFPHGGPHSSFAGDFSAYIAVFYSLGYSVLLLNFRGSSGYGQDSIESLPGHISIYDVQDCQQAAEHVFSKYNFKNAVVTGGSHGGFLTCQLIGQYPDFYRAAVARNPVTHLESMLFLTDIPDWCVCESMNENPYDPKMQVTPEILGKMYERSPMRHVDKVKTPTLLMIGMVDLRVPPSQGISYYKALLARNVPTKLLSFKEDNHPLEKPQTLADCIVHMILWFEKNIQ